MDGNAWAGARGAHYLFTAFVPCVINSYTGIKLTNKTLINVSRTFGASNAEIFWKVGVPSSLPMVFAGIRVALGNSWSTLVAAEMLAASAGLGYMIQIGRTVARPDIVSGNRGRAMGLPVPRKYPHDSGLLPDGHRKSRFAQLYILSLEVPVHGSVGYGRRHPHLSS